MLSERKPLPDDPCADCQHPRAEHRWDDDMGGWCVRGKGTAGRVSLYCDCEGFREAPTDAK